MKFPATLLLALAAALTVLSCATVPPGTPATPVSTFDNCSDSALKTAAEGLLGQIATAVASNDYAGQLAILAANTSAAEVKCGVQLFIAEFKAKAAVDPLAAKQYTNAQAWLAMQK